MKTWILFALFLVAGVGILIAGIAYMYKEKNDPESVKIYRIVSIIGAVLAVGAVLIKFVF